ncbi:STAS domain-containing protein [Mycobacterium angelicum]|uniref:STAS domain-containing protein n=1 Tax=Mycobacterium angelicum TaxID=470074 RepID=UPI001B80025A|nr:sulfate transporter [Mycobacterium angelicum]
MVDPAPTIRVDVERHHQVSTLTADGVLDSSTYRSLRDTVIKAALDEPRAVIVDVNRLSVPSDSAWSVFTSARWHVSIWPDVPILLVSGDVKRRRTIASCGITRYVPVHPTRESALQAVANTPLALRRRARIDLPATRFGVRLARAVIADWLTRWDQQHLIPAAGTVATVFIENVLAHTCSAPVLVVENYQDEITIAVEDCNPRPATLREDADRGADILSGLAIVSALCRSWGSAPTLSGKTVWALVGPENRL